MLIDTLVEGVLDEAVAGRVLQYCGHSVGSRFGRNGISYLQKKIQGFNVRAAYGRPILALVDLMDTRLPCPSAVVAAWLPDRSAQMHLRVVVREIESWLLADREGIAHFLGVPVSIIPQQPETLPNPKEDLVSLARRSRRKAIRQSLAPRPGISAIVGAEYTAMLEEFTLTVWNVDIACVAAPSLARCVQRLRSLHE